MLATAPLPTRVKRACDRCRRNKSRCDSYRPCSLCLRADTQCRNTADTPSSAGFNDDPASRERSLFTAPEPSSAKRKRRRLNQGPSEVTASTLVHHDLFPQPRVPISRPSTERVNDSAAEFEDVSGDSAINIARKLHTLQTQSSYDHAVDAIPGANDSPVMHASTSAAPTSSYLTHALPNQTDVEELLEEYFDSVHWFSLVIVVPKFRLACDAVRAGYATPSEKPFLLLLSTILGLSARYRAYRAPPGSARNQWLELSTRMIVNAESQLVYILDQRSVTAMQTLILLGSFYVYHGRPNLSFSLLGATIKAAQSMGLHKSCPNMLHLDREERKRVWWTIYTWDRFASVNYGQPFGISEKVCNVEQPEDTLEEPIVQGMDDSRQQQSICYSTYQRELNKLYTIASPAIERVYRTDGNQEWRTTKDYHVLVGHATRQIWRWRSELPDHLRLGVDRDWPLILSTRDKAYRLQSLSLYLTFDSLMLVLHRPFMKQRLDSLYSSSPAHGTNLPEVDRPSLDTSTSHETSSHEQLWSTAVRTTKVTELPQLAQHATDGHLINFLTMNVFNAAVVLIVMALSNPLSDRAQEAKRAVARVYRMQLALGSRSVLSQQSAAVLRSLVQLLTSRESHIILAPVITAGSRATPENGQDTVAPDTMTVRDALSMPLCAYFEDSEAKADGIGAGAGNVAHLHHGLESVQKAFAGMSDGRFSSRNQSRRPSHVPDDINGQAVPVAPSQQLTFNDDLQPGMDWQSFEPGGDIGMHWIWDPAWDNLFSNVDL